MQAELSCTHQQMSAVLQCGAERYGRLLSVTAARRCQQQQHPVEENQFKIQCIRAAVVYHQ